MPDGQTKTAGKFPGRLLVWCRPGEQDDAASAARDRPGRHRAAAGAAVFLGGWHGPLLPGAVWMALKSLGLVAEAKGIARRAIELNHVGYAAMRMQPARIDRKCR